MTIPTVFVQDAPTIIQGTSFKMVSGQTRRFPGGQLGKHRKQIVITNEDETTKVYLAKSEDTSGAQYKIMCVFAKSSITLFTNAEIILHVPSGTVDNIHILETFYTGAGNLVV